MRKLTYFVACSIDGFIGDPAGDASSMFAFLDEEFLDHLTSTYPETIAAHAREPLGIQEAESRTDASFAFEAGWNPDGAVCVARTRIPANISVERLKVSCPRLAAVPVCAEGSARAGGALLFNRSR